MPKNFSELLYEARRKKGITLRKLGTYVNLSPSYLSALERGERLPPKNNPAIKDLSIVLDIDQDDLQDSLDLARIRRSPQFFDKIYNSNPDLAFGFYRAAEEASNNDLQEALKSALKELKSRRGKKSG